ncbi:MULTISPECIES: DUF547 domain-containing protein [unclassified Flavobacterium]|uniref:DUF547 domain-containing protein n=1 Tax=unclassified Flavobacterium TaxID=196869 RepID=UPI003F929F12
MENYLIALSEKILKDAQDNLDTAQLRRELHYLKLNKLEGFLSSDDLKKHFWTNIYNAFAIIIAKEASQTEAAFKYKRIKIARNILSLDDIEYKILKLNKSNISQKLINALFSSNFIKRLAVDDVDYNIQLKLNRASLYKSNYNSTH